MGKTQSSDLNFGGIHSVKELKDVTISSLNEESVWLEAIPKSVLSHIRKLVSKVKAISDSGIGTTIIFPVLITDIEENITEDDSVILGSSFTPAITRVPFGYFSIDATTGAPRDIISGNVADVDGIHWNIKIAKDTEAILNVKITVLC